MWDTARRLSALLLALGVLALPSRASAWVETQIVSSVVSVDVSREGVAEVHHELQIRVNGGPLTSYEIGGIDVDAQPLPGAVVIRDGSASGRDDEIPLLQHLADDGSLLLEVDGGRGLKHGRFLLRFGYRTNLRKSGYLHAEGSRVTVRWVSPRFANGIDSMKVLWRLPSGSEAPSVPGATGDTSGLSLDEGSAGVFLASVRRSAERDEVELVRPHVATGEPVVWRVVAAADVFGMGQEARSSELTRVRLPDARPDEPARSGGAVVIAALLGFGYALLVWTKRLLLRRQASGLGLKLLPEPRWSWRSVAAGVSLGVAVLVLWRSPHLLGAAALAALAVILGWQTRLRVALTARGPGRWLPLHPSEAFRRPATLARLLDATTWPGVAVLAGALGILLASWRIGATAAPEVAWTLFFAGAVLMPVFFTGVSTVGPAALALRRPLWFRGLFRQLQNEGGGVRVIPWARLPDAANEPDELRLRIVPSVPRAGLVTIEVALQAPLGVVEPCVVVRVREGSDAHRVLSPVAPWVRGRTQAERVAVVHPRLPTRRMALALTRYLVTLVDARQPDGDPLDKARRQAVPAAQSAASRIARRSPGSSASTTNPGTSSLPLQAT